MKHLFAALALLLVGVAHGQNLVPNWSFEEYTECPYDFSTFGYAVGWQSICGSPDLFNQCCTTPFVSVPASYIGYQLPNTGNGFAGLGTFHFNSKEFMQAELSAPLVIGIPTYVSMHISPGGFGLVGVSSPSWASSGVGLRISVDPLPLCFDETAFDFDTALVHMPEVLNDTSSWTELTRTFVPDSAYRYVQLGNFFSDEQTLSEVLNPGGDGEFAYAFIDDVCVSQVPGGCDIAHGIAARTLDGINASLTPQGLVLDFGDFQRSRLTIRVFDVLGRSLWATTIDRATGRKEYPMITSTAGPYFVAISDLAGNSRTFKLLGLSE